jgi:VIT1/CCC1 family predicted Fe2+/Mn2+ transporter
MESKRTDPHNELHSNTKDTGKKLNWLRAAVLGANDGIVSTASIVVGVAGASNASGFIITAGVAGLTAGALSMAVGEYVSVSTQRDTEQAMLEKERYELLHQPEHELEELVSIYRAKGLKPDTARVVALELTAHDAFAAHADAELRTDPNNLTNPVAAAFASAVSFTVGGFIPLLAIILPPEGSRIAACFAAVLVALIATGMLSAKLGGAKKRRATIRVVAGGIIAMVVTFGVGTLFGVSGI